MEFVERLAGREQRRHRLVEAGYRELGSGAVDPRLFGLPADTSWDEDKKLDWVPGFSLTRSRSVLVPANLVFAPYQPDRDDKYLCHSDSNGLASGNNIEEAVLHGLLEVVERDAAMIGEYHRLERPEFATEGLPPEVLGLAGLLGERGYRSSFRSAMTDVDIPVVSAFLLSGADPSACCVAFGCDLDPRLAFSRALTEAVQLLPPSANQPEWRGSGSPEHYARTRPGRLEPSALTNRATDDLKKNIEVCVEALDRVGSEVVVVDLSLPEVPFPTVRVLATRLQPILRRDEMRLTPRFFEVPVKLGLREAPLEPGEVRVWPLCGYR
ncbi:MAG TPA: YcaO-like family protein, partial [Candidatus Bathyarchaeia archaeon]|nr:YcaO-like family protein [Candidatus Bathyarchaeia archaeon]